MFYCTTYTYKVFWPFLMYSIFHVFSTWLRPPSFSCSSPSRCPRPDGTPSFSLPPPPPSLRLPSPPSPRSSCSPSHLCFLLLLLLLCGLPGRHQRFSRSRGGWSRWPWSGTRWRSAKYILQSNSDNRKGSGRWSNFPTTHSIRISCLTEWRFTEFDCTWNTKETIQ